MDDGGEVAQRHGGVAVLLDGIEGGPELRHRRSGGQAATRAKPGLAERIRFMGNRLEPTWGNRAISSRTSSGVLDETGKPSFCAMPNMIG